VSNMSENNWAVRRRQQSLLGQGRVLQRAQAQGWMRRTGLTKRPPDQTKAHACKCKARAFKDLTP
jgi:hypothetical protein